MLDNLSNKSGKQGRFNTNGCVGADFLAAEASDAVRVIK